MNACEKNSVIRNAISKLNMVHDELLKLAAEGELTSRDFAQINALYAQLDMLEHESAPECHMPTFGELLSA